MAHKNSINKPKIKLQSNGHAKSLARKRLARASKTVSTRSSTTLRYAKSAQVAPRPTELYEVALYNGNALTATGVVTNRTLSNKRAKKLERNLRYIAQRLSTGKPTGDVDMDVDAVEQRLTQLEQTKAALWSVLEKKDSLRAVPLGEGTTMGVPAF